MIFWLSEMQFLKIPITGSFSILFQCFLVNVTLDLCYRNKRKHETAKTYPLPCIVPKWSDTVFKVWLFLEVMHLRVKMLFFRVKWFVYLLDRSRGRHGKSSDEKYEECFSWHVCNYGAINICIPHGKFHAWQNTHPAFTCSK